MSKLKVMVIVAHQDDFEYDAGGTFARLREHYGDRLELKILATTRGSSGHHELPPEETAGRREKEAMASAAIIGAEYECLRGLNQAYLPGQMTLDKNALGGLWNAVRNFEPEYIFCPPLPSDPLQGVHIDHYNTAWAVRLTAYQYKVPNAYPSVTEPVKRKLICPVIINLDDTYISENNYHVSVNIDSSYDKKVQMLLCHKSQMLEWLPWIEGKEKHISEKEFFDNLRSAHSLANQAHGKPDDVPREYFCVTQWGRVASMHAVKRIFPFGEVTASIKKYINPAD